MTSTTETNGTTITRSNKEDGTSEVGTSTGLPEETAGLVGGPTAVNGETGNPSASTIAIGDSPREDQRAPARKEPAVSHLDTGGRPLFMAENSKGNNGQNKWMWANAMLVFGSKTETRSSNCLGAWCLRCEELGKSTKECYLNYHPTRNFKAISRHFKRCHPELNVDSGASSVASPPKKATENKRSIDNITLVSNRAPSSIQRSKRTKVSVGSPPSAGDSDPRSHLSLDKKGTRGHRIISPPTFHPCGAGCLVVVTEHMLSVPLYRSRTKPSCIDIYFSVVEKLNSLDMSQLKALEDLSPTQRAVEYVNAAGLTNASDMLLFLQGGPGFGAPVPNVNIGLEKNTSWAASALDQYSRVVLMDQRGTGKSSPVTKQCLEKLFPDLFLLDNPVNTTSKSLEELSETNPEDVKRVKQAVAEVSEFLAQFRADSIVQDAEDVKEALIGQSGNSKGPGPWGCALGQSFGGFCLMTYLSFVAKPPRVCLFTGGIPPMLTSTYDAYISLWSRVKERNLRYYEMYPGDIPIVKAIVKALLEEPAPLPSGGLLTARRFLQLGIDLGGSPSSFARFHAMLSDAFLDTDEEGDVDFNRSFLKAMDSAQSFDDHPIFFWLHESIYADGPEKSPTDWAAHCAYNHVIKESRDFDYQYTCILDDNAQPTLFFGEMMFPWMPEDYEELSGVGLQAVANDLACKKDWGRLFDSNQIRKVLEEGTCKAAAAVYHEDMYVDFDACMKVTARGGPLEKCNVWITNEYQHSGIRDNGAKIFEKLHSMALGSSRIPS